ncbi:MAG: hypothetical protein GF392_06540 [Candidatus Omnitrophica bacterium]|nr:hypothetical protein [Candidatus Omnitrophota bacterium]
MKLFRRKENLVKALFILSVGLIFMAAGTMAHADTYNWKDGVTGDWDDTSNWVEGTEPGTGDTAYVNGGVSSESQVSTAGNDSKYLRIGDGSSEQGSLSVSTGGDLSTYRIYNGAYEGAGSITQAGGSLSASNGIYMGFSGSSSSGTYDLSGGTLTAAYEYLGYYGDMSFIQTGGTHNVNNQMRLGYGYNANPATYDLQDGILNTNEVYIGTQYGNASGVMDQSGGTHNVTQLYISEDDDTGVYNLSGGTLDADHITLEDGDATFNYTAGALYVDNFNIDGYNVTVNLADTSGIGAFNVGYASGGEYVLGAGESLDVAEQNIAYAASATFIQQGGANTVSDMYLGRLGGTGTYVLEGGTLTVGSVQEGSGAGMLRINGGELDHTGTVMDVKYLDVGYGAGTNGSIDIGVGKDVDSYQSRIGYSNGTGSVSQTGGSHTVANNLYVGYSGSDSSGTYTLSGGTLTAASEYLGYYGDMSFTQTGGTHNVNNQMRLGYGGNTNPATYDLQDGILNTNEVYIGTQYGNASGVMNQSGGVHTVNDLYITDDSGDVGVYNLSGGMLDAGTITMNSGDASFNFTGGRLSADTFNGDLLVQFGGTLAPGNSPGTTTVNGDVVFNSGGIFEFEVAGLDLFDQLIADNITFESGSIIDVSFLNGYTPGNPETWSDIFSVSGAFLNNGLSFQAPAGYLSSDFQLVDGGDGTFDIRYLQTAPPPSAPELPMGMTQMMVLGLGGVLARFRRRA